MLISVANPEPLYYNIISPPLQFAKGQYYYSYNNYPTIYLLARVLLTRRSMRKRCQAQVTNSTMQSDGVLCRHTFTRNELNRNEDACKDIAKEDAQGLLTTKSIQVKQRTIQKCDKDCCLGTDTRIRRRALQPYKRTAS